MAGGGVVHQARHHKRMHAILSLLIDTAVILVLGLQAAAGGAQNHPGLGPEFTVKVQA